MRFSLGKICFILAMSAVSSSEIKALELTPDYVQVQSMGFEGLASFGLGYNISTWFQSSVSLGYTPQENGKDILQLNIGNHAYTGCLADNVIAYGGFTLIYGFDSDLFVVLPKRYPKGYYQPTSFRATLGGGLKMRVGDRSLVKLQYSLLDSEIAPLANSYRRVGKDLKFGSWLFGWELEI